MRDEVPICACISEKQAQIDRAYVREKLTLDPRSNMLTADAYENAIVKIAEGMRKKLNQECSDLSFSEMADVLFDICLSEIDNYFEGRN